MRSKVFLSRLSLSKLVAASVMVTWSSFLPADDFMTLFTTSQERALIDSNRYKVEAVIEAAPVVEEVIEEAPEVPILMTEISSEYQVSGITLSADGAHSVWVNGTMYESGDSLDDGSDVEVLAGKEIKARITTPDGGRHLAMAGETIKVTYEVPAAQQ